MEEPIKVIDAVPRTETRLAAVFRLLERPFLALDRLLERALPPSLNPLAQTGALANVSLAVAVISGVLLLFWYTPSVAEAHSSLEQAGWLGGFMRSLHRYSSDAAMFFVLLHAVRLFVARRFDGPRWVAWVTGLSLVAVLWFVGWLGYWLVWDVRAQALAVGSAQMIDPLPVFTDPLSRSFLRDETVSTALFFTIFFFHMLIPLVMGVLLWAHIGRVARPRFLVARGPTAWLVGTMVVVSALVPATSAEPAQMTAKLPTFTMDWWYLAPIVLTERLGAGALWGLSVFGAIVLFSVPWTLTRRRAQVAVVDLNRCNGCSHCADDCPYGAIVLVPRSDGRDRYELEARVDPDRCVGCGICAGSCNPGGIGLPDMPPQVKRKIVDGWIDEVVEAGDEAFIAFLCANSAGGEFVVAPDGSCDDLPGYRCIPIPCSGWVNALSVERALRRGASGVVIVGCGCTDPPFREGVRWTDERLTSRRDPGLRLQHVDPRRVRFLKHGRGDGRALVAAAAAFRGDVDKAADPGVVPWKRLGAAALVSAAIAAVVVTFSNAPAAIPIDDVPELVVSLKHRPDPVDECRPATDTEKAQMMKHMRRDTICERGRPDVRLQVELDGAVVHEETFPAHGLSADGPSFAVVRVPIAAGEHEVSVRVGDTSTDAFTHETSQRFVAPPARLHVIEFENGVWTLSESAPRLDADL